MRICRVPLVGRRGEDLDQFLFDRQLRPSARCDAAVAAPAPAHTAVGRIFGAEQQPLGQFLWPCGLHVDRIDQRGETRVVATHQPPPGIAASRRASAVNASDSPLPLGRDFAARAVSRPPRRLQGRQQIDQAPRAERPHRHDLADRVIAQGPGVVLETLPRQAAARAILQPQVGQHRPRRRTRKMAVLEHLAGVIGRDPLDDDRGQLDQVLLGEPLPRRLVEIAEFQVRPIGRLKALGRGSSRNSRSVLGAIRSPRRGYRFTTLGVAIPEPLRETPELRATQSL